MSFSSYLELSRWDRLMLHRTLSEFVSAHNGEMEDNPGATTPPRSIRREGLF